MSTEPKKACVYLVGTGPGDPDLLTVKAHRLLQQADIVVYDRLVSKEILEQIPKGVSLLYVGKKPGHHSCSQSEINERLVELAACNRVIVRLKGGDPFIFGRGSEEAAWLAAHQIPFEVVPGLTAASACATYAGIPLTHRGLAQGVQIVTGHCRADLPLDLDWKSLADERKTIVIYMGVANIGLIAKRLIEAGLSPRTPAAAIANGTTIEQQRILSTLDRLAEDTYRNGLGAPVLFVIGKVVQMAETLEWFNPEKFANEYLYPKESARSEHISHRAHKAQPA